MPSIPALSSIFKTLSNVNVFRLATVTPGDTTTTAALARAATTMPVAAITNFTANDYIFIEGDGGLELNQVTSAAALAIVPKYPITIAQSSGARIREAQLQAAGHIVEGSATIGGTSSRTAIPAATSAVPIGYLAVGGELSFGFGLLSFDHRSLALAFGQEELETGAGTSADPYTTLIDGLTLGLHGTLCVRATGLRYDGATIIVDMLNCYTTVSADINISGKQVAPIGVSGSCAAHIVRIVSA